MIGRSSFQAVIVRIQAPGNDQIMCGNELIDLIIQCAGRHQWKLLFEMQSYCGFAFDRGTIDY